MVTFHPPGEKSIPLKDLSACAEPARRAVWIDAFEPTKEEERALEEALGLDVPTREEMQEIELSRRLYREKDAVFLTAVVLTKSDSSHPESTAITFILTNRHLITLRYANPVPFQMFSRGWDSDGASYDAPAKVLAGLLDAIIERLADILENTASGIDRLSLEVLSEGAADSNPKKTPAQRDFRDILRRIGRFSDLASRGRESLVSLGRLISFIREERRDDTQFHDVLAHLSTVGGDLASLSDHSTFLSGKLSFLLDATLGLISNEQNSIIKIVSVATLVFLPPTLVASIYGMNFEHIPELKWDGGYPFALILMAISAILPYAFFKRKGWL